MRDSSSIPPADAAAVMGIDCGEGHSKTIETEWVLLEVHEAALAEAQREIERLQRELLVANDYIVRHKRDGFGKLRDSAPASPGVEEIEKQIWGGYWDARRGRSDEKIRQAIAAVRQLAREKADAEFVRDEAVKEGRQLAASAATTSGPSERAIERNPAVCCGTAVIRGTRFPIWTLLAQLGAGDSLSEIADNFEMDEVVLRQAIEEIISLVDATPPPADAGAESVLTREDLITQINKSAALAERDREIERPANSRRRN